MQRDLARCDREIAEILERKDVQAGTTPAWLVTLGIEDWEMERRLIMTKGISKAETDRIAAGLTAEWSTAAEVAKRIGAAIQSTASRLSGMAQIGLCEGRFTPRKGGAGIVSLYRRRLPLQAHRNNH